MSPIVVLLLGCSGGAGPDKAPDTGDTADTDPAVPIDCDAVEGTGSVVLIGRDTRDRAVLPSAAPTDATQAFGLAGPDALGRYYLSEPTGLVRRSDDGGCTWAEVGLLPGGPTGGGADAESADTAGGPDYVYYSLFTGPASPRVYAYVPGHLLASADGRTWTEVGELALRAPATLVVDPTDPDRLRGHSSAGIVTSTDGGATWSSVPAPDPEAWYNPGIDASDIDRVALGRRGLWVSTHGGAAWTERAFDGSPGLAWDEGVLHAFTHGGDDDADYHLRVSDDLGATFVDWPVSNDDPELSLSIFAAWDGLAVSAGYRYAVGEPVEGVVQLTTAADTVVHRLPGYEGAIGVAFGADRVLVAFSGPAAEWPD